MFWGGGSYIQIPAQGTSGCSQPTSLWHKQAAQGPKNFPVVFVLSQLGKNTRFASQVLAPVLMFQCSDAFHPQYRTQNVQSGLAFDELAWTLRTSLDWC